MADASHKIRPPRRFGEFRRLPALSVVVIAGEDIDALHRCLTALLAQVFDRAAYEIVVVDPEDRDELRAAVGVVAGIAGGAPPVQYVVSDGREGLAAARNRGWMYARGAVLAFIDDDAVPGRLWLDRGMAAMTPGVAVVQGGVRMLLSAQPSEHEREIAALARRGQLGSNCFVTRLALVAVGGFDERFSSAWRSDADLQFTVIEHFQDRQRIRPEPLAEVTLGPRPRMWHAGLQRQQCAQFDVLLRRKHPALFRERIGGLTLDLRSGLQVGAVLALAVTLVTAAFSDQQLAVSALLLWLLLTIGLCLHQVRESRVPSDDGVRGSRIGAFAMLVFDGMATPPLAVFWRLVGALRFRSTRPGRVMS